MIPYPYKLIFYMHTCHTIYLCILMQTLPEMSMYICIYMRVYVYFILFDVYRTSKDYTSYMTRVRENIHTHAYIQKCIPAIGYIPAFRYRFC
jgi:hypothetical protein